MKKLWHDSVKDMSEFETIISKVQGKLARGRDINKRDLYNLSCAMNSSRDCRIYSLYPSCVEVQLEPFSNSDERGFIWRYFTEGNGLAEIWYVTEFSLSNGRKVYNLSWDGGQNCYHCSYMLNISDSTTMLPVSRFEKAHLGRFAKILLEIYTTTQFY